MNRPRSKRFAIATASALVLFLGGMPQTVSWDEGVGLVASVHAAGRKAGQGAQGGHGGHDSGDSHDHDDGGHDSGGDSHDHDDGDSHDHDDGDEGHGSSGGKGKGPAYHGGRPHRSVGRGGASRAVVELIFESR